MSQAKQRRGVSTRRITAAALCVALTAAGAAAFGRSSGAIDRAPAKTLPGTTVTADGPVGTSGDSAPVGEIGLSSDADLSQLVVAGRSTLGPTSDLAALVAGLAPLPEGFPTPKGADVRAVSVTYHRSPQSFTAEISLTVPADLESIAIFYQATFAASAYTADSDENGSEDDNSPNRTLTFSKPGSSVEGAGTAIMIVQPVDGSATALTITVTDAISRAALDAVTAWPTRLPAVVDEGVAVEAIVASAVQGDSRELYLQAVYQFDGYNARQLRDAFIAGVEEERAVAVVQGAAADAEDGSETLQLSYQGLATLSIGFSDRSGGGAELTVFGRRLSA